MLLSTFSEPTEGLYHVEQNTQAFVQDECLGKGALYVTEDNVLWCDTASGKGFSLEYPAITLHAICKDTTHFPHQCLYCMVDGVLGDTGESEGMADGNEEDDAPPGEVRFVPDDIVALEKIYIAIADCQVLHPDEQEQLEEEMAGYPLDEGEEFFTNQDDAHSGLTENGQATLDRLEDIFQVQTPQDFVAMTNQTNGNVNGHGGTESGQFDDLED